MQLKMAELLMECEEEDLEPWQRRIKEVEDDEDDDDDELIFVREISGAKQPPANNAQVTQPNPFPCAENGTPIRGNTASFCPSNNHYKTASTGNTIAQPANTMYQPVTRPATSSAIVQPLPRPVGSPEPIKRPLTGCFPSHQPPRPSPTILQPVCRPATAPSNAQPACRNNAFPTAAQPAVRPVATITAQPVILNQGYIVNSPQVSSSNPPNVMYTLRPSTTLTQYQGVHPLSVTVNATPLVRPVQPLSQSLPVSVPTRTVPAAVHRPFPQMATVAKNLNLVTEPQQCLILNSQKTHQGISTQSSGASIGWNDNTVSEKRPAPIEISDDSPKKTKNAENECDNRLTDLSTSVKPPTLSQSSPTKVNAGTSSGTTPKHGPPFPRACPKCNIHFNLLEPMRKHMKFCCPDKVDHFFSGLANIEAMNAPGMIEDAEKGKLIMLVSDFYYGRYGGDLDLTQQEQKTHTFKCYSCHKVLKNNIRFMNHMKHHLELEKQSSESWENHTTCHHCYRQFPTPFQLQCHIESSHTLYESSTICKICELSFEAEQILLQHMKDNHKPGEMPYVCQVCNYRSSSFAEVDSHFRAHENTKSLLCPYCLRVIKCGTPYMQHYIKHQNKGVYRCPKCRLQFLTCKEKMDHKTLHHRTFLKPRQLEGLPPGTKVTIRASVGSIINSVSFPTNTVCTSPPSTALQASSTNNNTNAKITQVPLVKSNAQNTKPKVPPQTPEKKPASTTTTKRIKMINTALQNLRSMAGYHKCIECQLEVKDFEGHFHTYVHCSKCKFSTSCNKAYMNHMGSFHGRGSSKRAKGSKKAQKDKRRITLVCLNCDFLTDVSGLDDMAKHLNESHTHSCQVILENVSIFSSTLEGDMAKSRNESSVGERQKYCKIMLYDAKTSINQSKGEKTTITTIEESGTSESSKMSDQSSFSSHDKHVTPVEPVKDSVSTVKEEISNRDLTSETDQNLDNTCIGDTSDQSKVSLEDDRLDTESCKPNFAGEENCFVQFLRRRDEPKSICSDVSEQSSVHLEPLTPSEVLEHEATEILQKGTVTACHQIEAPCEQTDDTKEHAEMIPVFETDS